MDYADYFILSQIWVVGSLAAKQGRIFCWLMGLAWFGLALVEKYL